MAAVNLQLVDPASHFEHGGVTLSGSEVKTFPNTNEAVQRAIRGHIVRVIPKEEVSPAPELPAPAEVKKKVRTIPPTGAAND